MVRSKSDLVSTERDRTRGMVSCYTLTRAGFPPQGEPEVEVPSLRLGDPMATVVTDIGLLVVKFNLGSGEEEECVRLQSLLELWIEDAQ